MRARTVFLLAALTAPLPSLAQVPYNGYSVNPGYGGYGIGGGYGYGAQPQGYGAQPQGYGTNGYFNNGGGYGAGFAQPQQGGFSGANPTYSGTYQPRTPDDVMTPGRVRNDGSRDGGQNGKSPSVLLPSASPTSSSAVQAKKDPRGARFEGVAHVVDGNTFTLGSEVILLNGVDAPEIAQTCTDPTGLEWTCGRRARDKLVAFVENKKIVCTGISNVGQAVSATCRYGTVDVGKAMVAEGWAMSPKAVAPAYASDEAAAKGDRRGIWSGAAQAPWTYRSKH